MVVYFDIGDTLVDASFRLFPDVAEALKLLREAGLKLGLLSNTGTLTRAELKNMLPKDLGFEDFEAELVILSSEVGVEKPHPKIFGLALDRAQQAPLQVIYCSENLLEVISAQKSGMVGLRLIPGKDFSKLPSVLLDFFVKG